MLPATGNSITIRRCTSYDAAALTALARRTFYDTFISTCTEADMQYFLDSIYSEERIARELSDPADRIYVAEEAGKPVGFLRFLESPLQFPAPVAGKALELNRLYVDAAFKGSGLAQQLMEFYMEFARKRGYGLLWLGVWEHNERAKAFYRRYGFRFTGYTHPFPIGNTPQTDEWWALTIPEQ